MHQPCYKLSDGAGPSAPRADLVHAPNIVVRALGVDDLGPVALKLGEQATVGDQGGTEV
jgi:hypothetical protein